LSCEKIGRGEHTHADIDDGLHERALLLLRTSWCLSNGEISTSDSIAKDESKRLKTRAAALVDCSSAPETSTMAILD
jgi:hypothetical protein